MPDTSRHSMSRRRPVKMLTGRGKCWYLPVALQYWMTSFLLLVPSQYGSEKSKCRMARLTPSVSLSAFAMVVSPIPQAYRIRSRGPPPPAPSAPTSPRWGEVMESAARTAKRSRPREMFSSRAATTIYLSPLGRGRERSERVSNCLGEVALRPRQGSRLRAPGSAGFGLDPAGSPVRSAWQVVGAKCADQNGTAGSCGDGHRSRVPVLLLGHHRVEDGQQLAQASDQSNFFQFAAVEQRIVISLEDGIVFGRRPHHGHVGDIAQLASPT